MARKSGLGKGLAALIPQDGAEEGKKAGDEPVVNKEVKKESKGEEEKQERQKKTAGSRAGSRSGVKSNTRGSRTARQAKEEIQPVQSLPIEKIGPNPDQPRKNFEKGALEELADSIRKYGILEPIVVRKYTKAGAPPYQIVAGERRYRAAALAGLAEVPVVLSQERQEDIALLSLIENIQREDLSPLEEAASYQEIMQDHEMTQQELADAVGKSRSYIANTVRLLKLDPVSIKALEEGKLTASQGRALLGISDLKKREAYRNRLIQGSTNVNAVEKRTERHSKKEKDPYLREVEDQLSESLNTRVEIRKRRKGWTLSIDYYEREELEAVIQRLNEK